MYKLLSLSSDPKEHFNLSYDDDISVSYSSDSSDSNDSS